MGRAIPEKPNDSYRARARFALGRCLGASFDQGGKERCFLLTLTVGDWIDGRFEGVEDPGEVSRRWNSLRRHLVDWLGILRAVVVPERHRSGTIHLHVYIETIRPIGAGFSWETVDRLTARGLPRRVKWRVVARGAPGLGRAWGILRKRLPRFGFGRHELLPVKHGGAIGAYLGKYLAKAGEDRAGRTRFIGDWRLADGRRAMGGITPRGWSWHSTGGAIHRAVLSGFARAVKASSRDAWEVPIAEAWGAAWCGLMRKVLDGARQHGARQAAVWAARESRLLVSPRDIERGLMDALDIESRAVESQGEKP